VLSQQHATRSANLQEQCSPITTSGSAVCDTGAVNVPSVRAQARVRQIEIIKSTSRRLLAVHGAAGLSLREVAREMGLVSSAIYRYFSTRDELLTALIVDAYNDLGSATERAVARTDADPRAQLHATATAIRRWARRHPHEYALIFGSPVPGYEAPQLTIDAASRVTTVLSSIVTAAWRDHEGGPSVAPVAGLASMLERANLEAVMPGVPERTRARALLVWSGIFGLVSFELFGHFRGSVRNANAFFALAVDELADLVLP
jgi:AcrR family transcriptional regulator